MHGRYALYEVLGLPAQACVEDVKRAHKRLVQRHHPDRADATEKDVDIYRRITNAHHILCDPLKKEEYDRLGDGYDECDDVEDDELGDMAIPSFMFTAAPFITPYHPFSIFAQGVPDPLKAFADLRVDDKRGEEKRQIQGHLGSISDVEATLEDRMQALRGLLELCAKGNSTVVTESVLDDEDALPTIIEDIQNDEEDETIKFLSTELLHVVSTANYVDVYQTGGLPAVLSVLKTENTKVLHSALLSLQHLTQLGSACAECYKCNVVQYCVHLMHKKSIDVLLTASHILHNLVVEHADPHSAIVECRRLAAERYFGEIIRVVDEQHSKLEPPSKVAKSRRKDTRAHNSLSLQSQKVLTAVLAVLAASEESEYILINEEDARRLFEMLSYKGVRDVVTNACTVIQALLHNRRAILQAGDDLTDMLIDLTLALVRQEPALTAAVVLLTTIVHCGLLRSEDVSRREVGKLLVMHLKSKNEETSVAAARGLTYLCAPSIGESEFIACAYNAQGEIQYLDVASSLAPPASEEAGSTPATTPKLHRAIAPHLDSIVKQFLLVIQGNIEGTELRPASVMCAGLAALAQHEAGRKAMLRQPVLECLAQLLAKTGTNQVEKEAASLAVLNFSKVGKLVNPAGNPGHKEALRLLASQLHSKNQRIQACVISTFLNLAHDKVPLDCIYGRTLEQLKTTRVNSKLALQLHKVLSATEELAQNILDPSAASQKKRDQGKGRGKAKSNGQSKDCGAHSGNGADALSDSESAQSSDDSDGDRGGNNIFAALRGAKKKKKKDDGGGGGGAKQQQQQQHPTGSRNTNNSNSNSTPSSAPPPTATPAGGASGSLRPPAQDTSASSKRQRSKRGDAKEAPPREDRREKGQGQGQGQGQGKSAAKGGRAAEAEAAADRHDRAAGEAREGGRQHGRQQQQQSQYTIQPGEELRTRGDRSERGDREQGSRRGKKKRGQGGGGGGGGGDGAHASGNPAPSGGGNARGSRGDGKDGGDRRRDGKRDQGGHAQQQGGGKGDRRGTPPSSEASPGNSNASSGNAAKAKPQQGGEKHAKGSREKQRNQQGTTPATAMPPKQGQIPPTASPLPARSNAQAASARKGGGGGGVPLKSRVIEVKTEAAPEAGSKGARGDQTWAERLAPGGGGASPTAPAHSHNSGRGNTAGTPHKAQRDRAAPPATATAAAAAAPTAQPATAQPTAPSSTPAAPVRDANAAPLPTSEPRHRPAPIASAPLPAAGADAAAAPSAAAVPSASPQKPAGGDKAAPAPSAPALPPPPPLRQVLPGWEAGGGVDSQKGPSSSGPLDRLVKDLSSEGRGAAAGAAAPAGGAPKAPGSGLLSEWAQGKEKERQQPPDLLAAAPAKPAGVLAGSPHAAVGAPLPNNGHWSHPQQPQSQPPQLFGTEMLFGDFAQQKSAAGQPDGSKGYSAFSGIGGVGHDAPHAGNAGGNSGSGALRGTPIQWDQAPLGGVGSGKKGSGGSQAAPGAIGGFPAAIGRSTPVQPPQQVQPQGGYNPVNAAYFGADRGFAGQHNNGNTHAPGQRGASAGSGGSFGWGNESLMGFAEYVKQNAAMLQGNQQQAAPSSNPQFGNPAGGQAAGVQGSMVGVIGPPGGAGRSSFFDNAPLGGGGWHK